MVSIYLANNWTWKNWGFRTLVLEKTLESPLDSKEIQPVHPKENQCWIFIGRADAKAETPILWPPDAKNWLTVKDPDAGKDWRLEKGTTEDEMVGWPHWLDGYELEQARGVGAGQGSLVCCSSWCRKESDTTERLNWSKSAMPSDTGGRARGKFSPPSPDPSPWEEEEHLQNEALTTVS